MDELKRCDWCGDDPLYVEYHDKEWGVPVFDEQTLFEFITLEGAQAGLSWITILRKRDGYRKAFLNYDINALAALTDSQLEAMRDDPSIVRNKLKIYSVRSNAQAVQRLNNRGISLKDYIWQFVDGKPIINHFNKLSESPATSEISDRMAKQLKKDGFKFMGSTICYAFMQAVGMVNDHLTHCPRHKEVIDLTRHLND